jgi:hypothetical protein
MVEDRTNRRCVHRDEGWGWTFEVYNIEGWATDGGSSLHTQEDGCGALTGWDWNAATNTEYAHVWFNLPFFIKAGCVERAIVSAGGPELSCAGQGLAKRLSSGYEGGEEGEEDAEYHALAKRSMTLDSPSPPVETITPNYTYPASATTTSPYVPMSWNASESGTVILTWTLSTISSILITTETVVSVNSTVPIPSSAAASTSALSTSSLTSSGSTTSKSSSTTSKSSSTTSKTSTTTTTTSITPPGPTQSGIISTCNNYYVTVSGKSSLLPHLYPNTYILTLKTGDSCAAIEAKYSITFAQFYAWNPAIGSDCTSLWVDEAYCVGVSGSSSTSTTATSKTSSSLTPPAPTQSGITSSCTEYYVVVSGDSCAAIEAKYSITFAQFYAWNPAIGSDCTALWVGEAYCVAV